MEKSIFSYILRYSTPQQLQLAGLVLAYYPFLYLSLDLPKIIVNRAIDASHPPPYSMPVFEIDFSFDLEQLDFLFVLSGFYLLLVLINGAFKYYINVFKGQMGERLLRRMRYQLYARILRFPLPRFRKVSQGELIPMITSEVEPLGGFIGTAFVDPLFYGGQLVIILAFIMIQDPFLGAAAIALYPFQMYVIPKLQRHVNQLGKRRVQQVRRLSEHIGDSVSGIVEIHAHDTAQFELARFSERLGIIYFIRYEIYRRKFFIKFLNNFLDKLTPFFFFSIGGYLVIVGQLTFGALVAVLAAYKDLASPWKEMLLWYQQKEDIRIKYEQVVEQFEPPGMLSETLQRLPGPEEALPESLRGEVVLNGIGLVDEEGVRLLDNLAFTLPAGSHAAIVGEGGSGRTELALILSRLIAPTRGRVTIAGHDLFELPEAVTGRHIAYVGNAAHLAIGSIEENMLYGLKHRPREADHGREAGKAAEDVIEEALKSGNTPLDANADWTDYESAGASGPADLHRRLIEVLRIVELDRDVYTIGLRGTIDPEARPDVAERILEGRFALRDRLAADPVLAVLVEPFDRSRYNSNATVAENLLFGAPVDSRLDQDHLADHPYMRAILERLGLIDDFVAMGRMIAETMIELFAGLPPDHEFFSQYSFISAEELPEFQTIVDRASRNPDSLSADDRHRLEALPFKLIAARHRLGMIDETMQARILEAREAFAANLPPDLADAIAFFDAESFTPAASLQDNILFGKLAYGQANAEVKIGQAIQELVEQLGLVDTIISVGLAAPVGVGGGRLSPAQRQKVAIGRCVLKRPDLLIVNEAAEALDIGTQNRVIARVREALADAMLIWIPNRIEAAELFETVIVMRDGQVVEQGSYQSLREGQGALKQLLVA